MKVLLGDHVDLLTGFPFKSARYSESTDNVLLLRGDNIGQGVLRWDGAKRWPRSECSDYVQFVLKPADVVLAMDRPWIEAGLKWAYVREDAEKMLLVQRVARMRGTNGLRTDYLRYLIGSPAFTNHVLSITTGVNVPHISARDIKSFQFDLPPFNVQRRIAGILSAYDDLIEVNTRRITILEEMARRLFDEWFVSFRFPGSELATFYDTPLGPIPEGWSIVSLETYCQRITDGAHRSPPSVQDGKLMASVKDMQEWGFDLSTCRRITDNDFQDLVRNDCRPQVGDILIAKDGANLNKHTFLVTDELELVLLSSIAIIRPKPHVAAEFLVAMLKSSDVSERIKRSVSGAAIPRIILKDFKRLPVIQPPPALQQIWATLAGPIHQLCRKLFAANLSLRVARNLLLPKLLSGEIGVERLDGDVGRATSQVAAE